MSISSDVQTAEARAQALAGEFKSWVDQIGQSPELQNAKDSIEKAAQWVRAHLHGEEPPVDEDPDDDRSRDQYEVKNPSSTS